MNPWKNVSKSTFYKFIKQYPKELERSVHTICEPPQRHYNDWSKGDWPESVVAAVEFNLEGREVGWSLK